MNDPTPSQSTDIDQRALDVADALVAKMIERGALLATRGHDDKLRPMDLDRQFQLKAGWQVIIVAALASNPPSPASAPRSISDVDGNAAALEAVKANAFEIAARTIEARIPLYTDIGQINALRECASSVRGLTLPTSDAQEHSIAARYNRLHKICERILWADFGVPAMENKKTRAALDDIAEVMLTDVLIEASAALTLARQIADNT